MGLPGIVDVDAGTLGMGIVQLPELAERPLVELIRAKTGIDAFVDNDVNALALGEWRYGLARGAASLVVLALGTGLGGAVILDGRLVRGRSGYGGEFGHVPVKFDGRRCVCGARGCLGAYAAGYGIAMEYRRRVQGHRRPVKRGSPPPSEANAEEVFAAAAAGDARARAVIDEACRALGAALAVIVNGLNPEVIVVTGGVVTSLAPLQREIVQHASEHAFADPLAATRIHLVPGLKSQTLRGGAALVLYERARRAAGAMSAVFPCGGEVVVNRGVRAGSTPARCKMRLPPPRQACVIPAALRRHGGCSGVAPCTDLDDREEGRRARMHRGARDRAGPDTGEVDPCTSPGTG